MARGRLISRSLGSSRKFAALQKQAGKLGEFAQSLFPLLVANADDFGRQSGDAFTVKHAVFPTSPRKEQEFTAALTAMRSVGLLRWYTVDSQQVIEVVDFDAHQLNLHKRTESKFPGYSGNLPDVPSEFKRTELKRTEPNQTARDAQAEDGFERFWVDYPKKKSRSDAEKAWRKLAPSPELIQRIYDAIAAQRTSPAWTKDEGQFIPYPASWIRGRRWEDEEPAPKAAVGSSAYYARSWRLECHHEPPCNSYDWHCIRLEKEQASA